MSHVTYGWVMSHMNESCHIWMSHVTHKWDMSNMDASCHIWMSHVAHTKGCLSTFMKGKSCHIWMSHVAHSQSCHIWMSHVASYVTYQWVMSRTQRGAYRHVSHERVMSHMDESCFIWMSHVTQRKKSIGTPLLWKVTHAQVPAPFLHVNESWRI